MPRRGPSPFDKRVRSTGPRQVFGLKREDRTEPARACIDYLKGKKTTISTQNNGPRGTEEGLVAAAGGGLN